MSLIELKVDLFNIKPRENEAYAHCISRDCALGAGIAKEFEKRFQIKKELIEGGDYAIEQANCRLVEKDGVHIFNLVTKELCHQKPTLESLSNSLLALKKQCRMFGIRKLIMPKIGCGLDKLDWKDVKEKIMIAFAFSGIDVVICYLD